MNTHHEPSAYDTSRPLAREPKITYVTIELPMGAESYVLPTGIEHEIIGDTLVVRALRPRKQEAEQR